MSTVVNVNDVLRTRRHQPTRLEGFVDASFAFAVTLLVISIGHVPGSVAEMLHALRGLPAFALCVKRSGVRRIAALETAA